MSTNLSIPEDLIEFASALRPLVAEGLANDFAGFVKAAWPVLHPGRRLIWSWHNDLLCEYLMLVKQRKIRKMIANTPPRCLKTTMFTICFPCWVWLTEPSHAFLCASHSNSLSTDHSIARRRLISSAWYQSLWHDRFKLSPERNLTTQFANNHVGQMVATSTGSGAEGLGADTAILDDPMSSQQALSDSERCTNNRWVVNTLPQRLNDPATGAMIVIMQRLHEIDTTGFLLSEDPESWLHLVLRLVAEEDERWVFPISGRVVERKKGEVLQPTRFTPDVVAEKQRDRMVWAAQYQQRPAPLEGNMIKHSDASYFGGIDPKTGQPDERLPENFDLKLISVDCAFKDLATSDYTAILVIGVKGRKRFVLDVINEHLDATTTESKIRGLRDKHRPIGAVLVEDKANGPAVIERLKANIPGVVAINPKGGKVARMFAAAPEWQAGDWYVDRRAASTECLLEQLTMFPAGRHDDMVDAMTQAACWLASYQLPTVESHNAFTGEVSWSLNSGVWRTND